MGHVGPTAIRSAPTHPIDVILFVLWVGGGLSLIIGILALIGYGRGEMDLPAEARPKESHTSDDGLPAAPPPSMSNVIGRLWAHAPDRKKRPGPCYSAVGIVANSSHAASWSSSAWTARVMARVNFTSWWIACT